MSARDGDASDRTPTDSTASGAYSRREALKILGVVPAAAALGVPQPRTPLVPGAPQVATHAAAVPVAPRFFNAHEWKTVRMLADYIIPQDERSGSATDAKVPEYMDYLLAEKDASLATQTAMRGGLAWLDTQCQTRFQKTFTDAADAQRREVLDDIAYPAKAKPEMSYGVAFFNRFRDMTASGFFSSEAGWKDVQYIGNVFNPGYDGCPQAALDKLGVSYDLMQTRVAPEAK
ncbi:MAG TPA: gluconate 2-dehydrogenase subunit 3 family protein [Gemmatimonadaceae bacterium]|jgi:hypothetical protein|nr:gluconate 2-dehydrogenase subunit 3 family protein [Gemmatimonadaceae bacterium]